MTNGDLINGKSFGKKSKKNCSRKWSYTKTNNKRLFKSIKYNCMLKYKI